MTHLESATSAQLARDIIDDGPVSGQQLLVVGLCFIFNMLDGFDITAMAVVASSVAQDMDLTPDRLGWLFSIALAGMMAGAMFLAPLADQLGRRKLIITAVLTVGAAVLLTAQASSLVEFALLRFIAGMGAGAMLASVATLASEYSPDKYKALSVAVVISGYPAGAMLTSVAAGHIMPEYGWTGMFWVGGAITLLLGVVALLVIPESPSYLLERQPANALSRINRILRKLGRDELDELPPMEAQTRASNAGLIATMRKLLSSEYRLVTLALWAAFSLVVSSLYFLMSWIPKLMEDAGFTVADGRRAFFLFNLGAVVGIYLLGFLSTRWKLSNVIAAFAGASAAGMVLFATVTNDLQVLFAIIFCVGVFQQGGFTGLYAAAAKAYPSEMRSTGIGWAIGIGRTGAVLGPAIGGYLIAGGLDLSANFAVFAIPMALTAAFVWRLHIR